MNKLASTTFALVISCYVGTTFAATNFLADRHVSRSLTCESCHAVMPPKAVPTDQCLKCHVSYEALAKRTDKKDINPHDTHIEKPACSDCHQGHKKPVLVCDQCHEFAKIKVP